MDNEKPLQWVHIVEPERWQVAKFQVEVCNEMIFMVIEDFEPLLKGFFSGKAHKKMLQQDLILLAEHLA